MNMRQMIARIESDQDQDQAMCDQWFREATTADLMAVWLRISKPYQDPVNEIMSRFAQLAFSEAVLKHRARFEDPR